MMANMTPAEKDEYLFWGYQKAKSMWRRHVRKPARKVRRLMRRSKGKGGKGDKGKGKWRYRFIDEMTDEDVDFVYSGGKRTSKRKRRSSGEGKVGDKTLVAKTAKL